MEVLKCLLKRNHELSVKLNFICEKEETLTLVIENMTTFDFLNWSPRMVKTHKVKTQHSYNNNYTLLKVCQ